MRATCVEVLVRCTEEAGLEFDPVAARRAILGVAEGSSPGGWRDGLAEAGKDLGFRVTGLRASARAAIAVVAPGLPLVAFEPEPEMPAAGRWLVLVERRGGRARVAGLAPGEADRWVGAAELARLRGVADAEAPAEWAALQPIALCGSLGDSGAADGHGHHEAPSPVRRLLGLMRPEGQDLRTVVAFAVGVGVLSLATPLAIEALVTTVAMNLLVQQLVVLSLLLLVCLGFAAALRAAQTYVVEVLQRRVFARVASDLAHRLPRVRRDAFDGDYGPELVNRFFDVLTVQKVGAALLLDGLAVVLQALIGLAVLAFYHPYLLGFDLVILAAMSFAVVGLGRGAIATSIQESRAKYAVVGQLEELARMPLTYRSEGGAELALTRADALARRYLEARGRHFAIVWRQVLFALGFGAVASTALLGLGGWLVIQGQLTLGQLVAAELIVATVVSSFAKLGKHLEGWYDLMAAVDKLGHLVDLPTERRDGEALPPGTGPAGLRLRGVSFSYDGHREVLHLLDLDVAPGDRVAIVGPSGSGKSTLVDLIFGLRAPAAGAVELDGINVRDLRLESLRAAVAAVKAPEILEGTILDNVRVGREALSLAEVHEALEAVGLREELAALPDGLHTRLAADGGPLSHGQVRRLMLTRAIAGKPRLLVLDEALDGLDLDARRRVIDSLFDPRAPWTLLVVTHSQEVARHCRRAVALAGGGAEHSVAMANGHSPDLEDWLKEAPRCHPH
ncbi:MAG TPA: ABC transporter ATP-binding protein [Isosphaeraceae bacterium]|jgi:ABC-type bacteriocin/lantibiotic exporter with double-glycine peptidase domain